MLAEVDLTASTFSFLPPTRLMDWPNSRGTGYDVAKDGRILAIKAIEGIGPQRIVVIENWFTELNQLVPLGGE